MKKIQLTNGGVALISDEDYPKVSKLKWMNHFDGWHNYAARTTNKGISMHRYLMGDPKGKFVDHIDGNGLNNQRSNLRICTPQESSMNRVLSSNNTSGYKGVMWSKSQHKWIARITFNYKRYNLGRFINVADAAKAYNEAAVKYFGEFAKLNIIDP